MYPGRHRAWVTTTTRGKLLETALRASKAAKSVSMRRGAEDASSVAYNPCRHAGRRAASLRHRVQARLREGGVQRPGMARVS